MNAGSINPWKVDSPADGDQQKVSNGIELGATAYASEVSRISVRRREHSLTVLVDARDERVPLRWGNTGQCQSSHAVVDPFAGDAELDNASLHHALRPMTSGMPFAT